MPSQDYDSALKKTLQGVGLFMRELIGTRVARWHNVELPELRNPRLDMLGETESGELVHIEAQSQNDPAMALRMAEYALRVYRRYGRLPIQIVLYFGEAEMRIPAELRGAGVSFAYRLVDVRSLAAEPLIESSSLDDNIFALLTGLANARAAVQRVLQRIIELPSHLRVEALRRVVTLMGLRRKIGPLLEEEARKMPITEDILDHPILGPRMRESMELGLAQGSEQGIKRGELAILTDLIAKRFGPPEAWVSLTLEKMNAEELRTVAVRVLDAKSVAELFD